MSNYVSRTMAFALVLLVAGDATIMGGQSLAGRIGQSNEFGSGWIDLASPAEFQKGDRLRLTVGASAKKVIVRLLPRNFAADSRQGLVGGVVTVPENRIVEIVIDSDRRGVIQISVHGGPSPWGIYPLGPENGPATLDSAELIRIKR